MGDSLDRLFQEWHCPGGAVLLSHPAPTLRARSPEEVLAESTAHCRESGRLTWVALDWLIRHVEQVDAQALLEKTLDCGELRYL